LSRIIKLLISSTFRDEDSRKEEDSMATFKCDSCGAEKEGRCKPKKCPKCGDTGKMTKKE